VLRSLISFVKLQFSAAIFGILILSLIMVTSMIWQDGWPIYRYDFLFVAVVVFQAWLLWTGRETWAEARVIFVFHIVGVIMEIFKTSVGAWVYPEPAILRIGGVPLFTGFMYSAVGSYIARGWKLTDMRLSGAPAESAGGLLALAIYINFYSHHFIPDIRYVLMAVTVLLYWRCWAHFPTLGRAPILALFFLVGVLVYVAENIGSLSGTWLYPNQMNEWRLVPIGKLGSWTLLMIVSFSLVRLVKRDPVETETAPN
jgi:uncharacterized membrane protein YoaT (DUF817 family)